MVKTPNQRYTRIGERHLPQIIRILVLGFVGLLVVIFLDIIIFPKDDSYGIVLVGNPINIYWWNQDDRKFSVIKIPADAMTNADPEFSQYTFNSLWILGSIGNHDPLLLNRMISQTLELPVKWYIAGKDKTDADLSGNDFFGLLWGAWKTNLPLLKKISFIRQKLLVKPVANQIYDLTKPAYLETRHLANNQTVKYCRLDLIDNYLGNNFEFESVRSENLKIAVANASDVSGLGNNFAKILNQLGIYVSLVSNRPRINSDCILSGTTPMLKTKTAQIMENFFECQPDVVPEAKPYDLEVAINADLFPFLSPIK